MLQPLELDGTSTNIVLLVALAVAPTVFLLWLFYHMDRYKHESIKLLSATFFLGALVTIPALGLELLLQALIPAGQDLVSIFLFFLVGVASVEETLKLLAVRVYAYRSVHFDEPMDGIILGVAAALGFATVENLGYSLQYGAVTAVVRAFVSVPSHALFGAIIGYYLGEAKFHRKPWLALVGLSFAVVLHATFDTLSATLPEVTGVVALFLVVLVIYFGVVKREIDRAEEESPYRS
jgi:protease PrsW